MGVSPRYVPLYSMCSDAGVNVIPQSQKAACNKHAGSGFLGETLSTETKARKRANTSQSGSQLVSLFNSNEVRVVCC